LRWQVQRCLAKSEFYREKFRQAGVKPAHIKTVDDLIKEYLCSRRQARAR